MKQTQAGTLIALSALCILGREDAARANAGFGLNDGLADWTANAYAGEAAKAYDAGTAWTNPAGEVRLHGFESDVSLTLEDPDLNFHGTGQANGVAIGGPQSTSGENAAFTAGSGTVISLTRDLKIGFAVASPFASRLAFTPTEYVGRYQDTDAEPTIVQGIFSMAYAFNRHFSIGGGPMISYFKVRQGHALNLQDVSLGGGGALDLEPGGNDPIAEFRGDDLAAGYDIGGLYQFNDNFRIGVNYHSRVNHTLQGYQSIFIPGDLGSVPGLGPIILSSLKSQITDVNVKVTLPDWADTSFYWQVTPEWAVMGNATWTNWSLFQNERVNPNSPSIPVTTNIQFNFHDTVTAGIGANYQPNWQKRLLLQTGITYDQSPVDDATRQGPFPDADRIEVGFGASYRITRMTTVQFAYAHWFFPDANTIDNGIGGQSLPVSIGGATLTATAPAGTVQGHYDIDNNVFSLGLKTFF